MRALRAFLLACVTTLVLLAACGDPPAMAPRYAAPARDAGDERGDPSDADARAFDFALPPPGVPDRGRSAGLVLVRAGVVLRCAAALIASNVALVPAPCIAGPACAAPAPEGLAIESADDPPALVAGVRAIMLDGDPCDASALAALVLAEHADGVAPLAMRARPVAAGELVRFAAVTPGGAFGRLLRDHLRVDESARTIARVAGNGCTILPGGTALDEATGELVAIGQAADACDVASVGLVQTDAFRAVISRALAAAAAPLVDDDGGLRDGGRPRLGKAARPTLDLGDACAAGADCAAGVCVLEAGRGYCSRSCGAGDRCPSGMRCERAAEGRTVCVESG